MCVGASARRWKALSGSCPGVFLNMPDLDMMFARKEAEAEYFLRMRETLHTDNSSEIDEVDFYCCCLPRLLISFNLVR